MSATRRQADLASVSQKRDLALKPLATGRRPDILDRLLTIDLDARLSPATRVASRPEPPSNRFALGRGFCR
jgi:hypothetical protein